MPVTFHKRSSSVPTFPPVSREKPLLKVMPPQRIPLNSPRSWDRGRFAYVPDGDYGRRAVTDSARCLKSMRDEGRWSKGLLHRVDFSVKPTRAGAHTSSKLSQSPYSTPIHSYSHDALVRLCCPEWIGSSSSFVHAYFHEMAPAIITYATAPRRPKPARAQREENGLRGPRAAQIIVP